MSELDKIFKSCNSRENSCLRNRMRPTILDVIKKKKKGGLSLSNLATWSSWMKLSYFRAVVEKEARWMWVVVNLSIWLKTAG